MLVAAGVMCISSWIGTLAGLSAAGAILACTIAGLLYGMVWTLSPARRLDCAARRRVARDLNGLSRPRAWRTHPRFAGAGGWTFANALRTRILAEFQVRSPRLLAERTTASLETLSKALREAAKPAGARRSGLHWFWRIAAALYRWLALPNGYWIPMTAAIVMKGTLRQTFQRGLARIIGTLAGAALATLIAATLRPDPWILAALVVHLYRIMLPADLRELRDLRSLPDFLCCVSARAGRIARKRRYRATVR